MAFKACLQGLTRQQIQNKAKLPSPHVVESSVQELVGSPCCTTGRGHGSRVGWCEGDSGCHVPSSVLPREAYRSLCGILCKVCSAEKTSRCGLSENGFSPLTTRGEESRLPVFIPIAGCSSSCCFAGIRLRLLRSLCRDNGLVPAVKQAALALRNLLL